MILDLGTGTGLVWAFLEISRWGVDLPDYKNQSFEGWLADHSSPITILESDLHDNPEDSSDTSLEVEGDQNHKFGETESPWLDYLPPAILHSASSDSLSRRRFIGLDLSHGMLQVFKHNCTRLGTSNVHLICGDCEHLPFRNTLFPQIFSLTTLQNLPDPVLGLSELYRVAKQDCRVGITVLKKSLTKDEFKELCFRFWNDFVLINPIELGFDADLEDWLGYRT
jgi:SAM-dependent methyltransferase